MKAKQIEFTGMVNAALGDGFNDEDFVNDPEFEHLGTPLYPSYADDDDDDDDDGGETPQAPDADDANASPDADTYDQYVGAYVNLPIGDKMLSAKVRGRKRALDRTLT